MNGWLDGEEDEGTGKKRKRRKNNVFSASPQQNCV
jgi:hypothetical protein